mmetsp:Transcript_86437/g.231564  ORF Transcript_86437/g.231564 Transcript_86437/m.231564 type:complete len:226 (-) Transcript_86437:1706-2383(-)
MRPLVRNLLLGERNCFHLHPRPFDTFVIFLLFLGRVQGGHVLQYGFRSVAGDDAASSVGFLGGWGLLVVLRAEVGIGVQITLRGCRLGLVLGLAVLLGVVGFLRLFPLLLGFLFFRLRLLLLDVWWCRALLVLLLGLADPLQGRVLVHLVLGRFVDLVLPGTPAIVAVVVLLPHDVELLEPSFCRFGVGFEGVRGLVRLLLLLFLGSVNGGLMRLASRAGLLLPA